MSDKHDQQNTQPLLSQLPPRKNRGGREGALTRGGGGGHLFQILPIIGALIQRVRLFEGRCLFKDLRYYTFCSLCLFSLAENKQQLIDDTRIYHVTMSHTYRQ